MIGKCILLHFCAAHVQHSETSLNVKETIILGLNIYSINRENGAAGMAWGQPMRLGIMGVASRGSLKDK